jgi:hypothetical protein
MPSPIVLINGDSYRVGQIGAYVRIPLGYTQLYAICTQIGADAMPPAALSANDVSHPGSAAAAMSGFRWMTVALFGEGVAKEFERGVSQYPTIGDEVHLVTADDLNTIYGRVARRSGTVSVGQIAGSSGIPAELNVSGMVSRHTVVVGSTGSGKSNLVAVLLEAVSGGVFPSARTLVVDPHGEYASAVGDRAAVFRVSPDASKGERQLRVPFWALPFEHLCALTLGPLQANHEAVIREIVVDLKLASSQKLKQAPPASAVTADSPIPFSLKKLWHDLDEFEGMTFSVAGNGQNDTTMYAPIDAGDPEALKPTRYPPASPHNQAPYYNAKRRFIDRQLTMMRTRLKDPRFAFLFNPAGGCAPDSEGKIGSDLDAVVSEWVGHEKPITVLDVSGIPSEVRATIVGTMLRVVYDCLLWAGSLPVSGRNQPLFIVLDEAHLFVPDDRRSLAHDTLAMIAKEGRKYGIGLMLVTQRPSELDKSVMSQCGSLIALRLTNGADRAHVAAAVPDDLGGLIEQLPTLRTGEGLFLGEVLPIPSRVRVRKAANKPVGGDPLLDERWRNSPRPSSTHYEAALANWRAQAVLDPVPDAAEGDAKEP